MRLVFISMLDNKRNCMDKLLYVAQNICQTLEEWQRYEARTQLLPYLNKCLLSPSTFDSSTFNPEILDRWSVEVGTCATLAEFSVSIIKK